MLFVHEPCLVTDSLVQAVIRIFEHDDAAENGLVVKEFIKEGKQKGVISLNIRCLSHQAHLASAAVFHALDPADRLAPASWVPDAQVSMGHGPCQVTRQHAAKAGAFEVAAGHCWPAVSRLGSFGNTWAVSQTPANRPPGQLEPWQLLLRCGLPSPFFKL